MHIRDIFASERTTVSFEFFPPKTVLEAEAHNDVRGLHFYTLNKSDATRRVYSNRGLKDSLSLRLADARTPVLR